VTHHREIVLFPRDAVWRHGRDGHLVPDDGASADDRPDYGRSGRVVKGIRECRHDCVRCADTPAAGAAFTLDSHEAVG
jgi:hypothetical protein